MEPGIPENQVIDLSQESFVARGVYIPPSGGARYIALNAQPYRTRSLLRIALSVTFAEAIFVTFFPSISGTIERHGLIMLKIATEREFHELVNCLNFDELFLDQCSKLVRGQVSLFHPVC